MLDDKVIIDYKELVDEIEIKAETYDSVIIDFKETQDNIIIEF